jgi:hypothetical protein
MKGALIGLVMLCAVAGGTLGSPQTILSHPGALIASARNDFQTMVSFANGAFAVAPDLRSRMSTCEADLASAGCSAIR